jgi:hypothetical protein
MKIYSIGSFVCTSDTKKCLCLVSSSCQNLIINTSKILLRCIVSHLVNCYHDLNDAHNRPVQSADNRHRHFFVSLVHTNEPIPTEKQYTRKMLRKIPEKKL